ncbi:hypothetical protein WR25_22801 [Diploscapter pachys]|uniref:SXP/RAL-2 family protein Ani s 5-like cation-binding domain-containing protein n=1 Tax=Diploscapter pachys TaxID=2018661 RepID=A0A2A2JJL8_9BILA|nr:hypothetical protein WR25_22801 [Diploscapter pachys]
MKYLAASLCFLAVANAQFPGGFPGGGFPPGPPPGGMPMPPVPQNLPPGFEKVLPSETVAQLKQIHRSTTMTNMEKHNAIDKIMASLPDDIIDKLPPPPGFEKLPQDVQQQLKAVHKDRNLSFEQRFHKINQIIGSLPESVRRMLPPPPPPPGFEAIPEQARMALMAIHQDSSMSPQQRFHKIRAVIDSLPAEVRARLPAPRF